ncbi:MAG: Hsp20/alpha crystallin family protein [Deltaproteobacteria bacterium]|nr:Hsp20/alpha crystallin family protein [Deltaproteobacteria bacterium]
MLLGRYSAQPFDLLRTEVDRLFDDFTRTKPSRNISTSFRKGLRPALNVWENQECYYVEAECPGLAIEDIELSVTGNQLNISAEQKQKVEDEKGVEFHRRERQTGSFNRVITFSTDVDAQKVSASIKNGVLTIQVPKAESAKPRKIEVRSQ